MDNIKIFHFIVVFLTGWVNRHQQAVIGYLNSGKSLFQTTTPELHVLLNDPTAQAVIKDNNLSDEETREVGESITNITVNVSKTEQ